MEKDDRADYKAHVLVLPFYGQGHMNPMLQFSKRLASKGIKITVATNLSYIQTIQLGAGPICLESVFDDSTENGYRGPGGFPGYIQRYEASCKQMLPQLIRKQDSSTDPTVNCLVYDANLPWALDIAKDHGLLAAAFFTQSCAAIASYYSMQAELAEEPLKVPAFSKTALPKPSIQNLQMPGGMISGRAPPVLMIILKQFSNIDKADWVLFNSFDKLEKEVVEWMSNLWSVRTIGPTVPSVYLDKKLEDDTDYGFSLFKPSSETCMKWLNGKEAGSVVYISFGSTANLLPQQMEEIAWALKRSSHNFLWVVKGSEEKKLPGSFVEETSSERGLVVRWCPQLEVLAHPAVGCFMTHCGWNSTLEALSMGVPMVGVPQILDQLPNAHFVEEVWGVGVTAKAEDAGVTTGEEIGRCIREVMDGGRAEEIKKKAAKWKEMGKEAVDEGGSSNKHIDEIVARLAGL